MRFILESGRRVAVHFARTRALWPAADGEAGREHRLVVFCHCAPGAGLFDPDPVQTHARKVTLLAVEMGIAILVEVILSFVGISVSGDTPTWGSMIAEGRQIVYQAPWIMALPIVCIILSVIGLNLLGDGLRLALDPVQRS